MIETYCAVVNRSTRGRDKVNITGLIPDPTWFIFIGGCLRLTTSHMLKIKSYVISLRKIANDTRLKHISTLIVGSIK